jgi:predicted enzyme related to lactoylglutathione lyase
MTSPYGQFCWYELITPDPAGAKAFYSKVIGWATKPVAPDYDVFEAGGAGVGGVMALNDELKALGVPPNWGGYVFVEDVEAAAHKVVELGGAVRRPPTDIPNMGRFAVVADPQGAVFLLFQDTQNATRPPVDPKAVGQCGWRELMATDWKAAFDFYAEMFGWTKHDAVDMGPMGTYQTFAIDGVQSGGMMNRPPQLPAPFWGYYFRVAGADAAVERIEAGGGKVEMGPVQVPTGEWVVQAVDPARRPLQPGRAGALKSSSRPAPVALTDLTAEGAEATQRYAEGASRRIE